MFGAGPVAITQAFFKRKSAFVPAEKPPVPPSNRRQERLAEALRANLKRRKAGQKTRGTAKAEEEKNDLPGAGPQAGLRDKPGS
jgi:hypothetical protein